MRQAVNDAPCNLVAGMTGEQGAAGEPRPLTFSLLRLLADGEFHSGEVLAQQLQVSRASVNNALSDVGQYGLTLHRIRGRGYRLPNPPQWLEVNRLHTLLGKDAGIFGIQILDTAVSSNSLLLQRAAAGAAHGSVLAVEWQSGGRGRLGRQWHSGLGNALTFSLLWRFDCGLSGLSGLSLVVGIALVRALRQLGLQGVGLKWPNDLVAAEGKLSGILIEAQGDMLGPTAVVIGIGINCSLPDAVMERIDQPVSDLSRLSGGQQPDRNLLLAMVLRQMANVLGVFAQSGFASFREEWENCHIFQDKPVQLRLPDGDTVGGIARGVNEEGALLVETQSLAGGSARVQAYHAGEISLRGI